MLDKYTVTLRGEPFTLYRDQIEFDAPNYFTNVFLGDFAESQSRSVELSRSPELFRIIVNYLSGYTILPLPATIVPLAMTSDVALENLALDADFYGLQGLVQLLASHQSPKPLDSLLGALQSFSLAGPIVPISDLLCGSLPGDVTCDQRGVGSVRDGMWHPVPLKGENFIFVARGLGYESVVMTLTDPLAHQTLSNTFTQRGIPVTLSTTRLDSRDYSAVPCILAPSGHTSVEGVNADGAILSTQIGVSLHRPQLLGPEPLNDVLTKIRRAEGGEFVVFLAEEVVLPSNRLYPESCKANFASWQRDSFHVIPLPVVFCNTVLRRVHILEDLHSLLARRRRS